MEVPRLGVKSELQPPHSSYATATAMPDPNHVCYTHHNARSLTCGVRPGIEPASSWMLVKFVSAEPHGNSKSPIQLALLLVIFLTKKQMQRAAIGLVQRHMVLTLQKPGFEAGSYNHMTNAFSNYPDVLFIYFFSNFSMCFCLLITNEFRDQRVHLLIFSTRPRTWPGTQKVLVSQILPVSLVLLSPREVLESSREKQGRHEELACQQ